MTFLVEKRGPQRVVLDIHQAERSVNSNGGGQVNHVNAAENQDNAPHNAANNAPQNILEADRRPN